MRRSVVIIGTILFFLTIFGMLWWRMQLPTSSVFENDAAQYSAGAISLVQHGMYSLDGMQHTMEREPGYSAFLAVIYAIFGIENRMALFLVQALIMLAATFVFSRELSKHVSGRIAEITFLFLLLSPAVWRVIFFAYRESLTLSAFLLFATCILRWRRTRSWRDVILGGFLLGCILLTYYPFVFFPVFLTALVFFWRMPKRCVVALILIPYLCTSLWALRNYERFGTFAVAGSWRSVIVVYVRGEQAERVTGLEPFRCLWSEYVSRDWTGRSDACSFNGLMHVKWPNGAADPTDLATAKQEGVKKILTHFPSYLWFSVFEILELHLPFVGGGWPFWFNLLVTINMAILYLGMLLGVRRIWKREYALFFILGGYNMALFIMTDATPRYLMPVFFCYAVLSAIGFARLSKQ